MSILRTLARILTLASIPGLAAVTALAASAATPQRAPVVLAAASLQEALSEAARRWKTAGRPQPVISYAGSAALARQAESGAPADLYISADGQWMDYLAAKGLIRNGSRAPLLSNRLVLIARAGDRTQLTIGRGFPLARALGGKRLAIANPESVPAGRYAKAALVHYGVWPSVRTSLAPTDNVRAVLVLVERGEAPFGIVYATDARASKRVRVVGMFPAASHPPIIYPVALLKRSGNPEAAAFRRFLLSETGRSIFARHGFVTR